MTEPIPGPRGVPVLGNVFDLDTADPLGGFVRMAETYGPIFKISAMGTLRLLIFDRKLGSWPSRLIE